MIKEHWLFLTIFGFTILLIVGITIQGLHLTGYSVARPAKPLYCEPLSCEARGLEPGNFYCDETMCYRDCYQNGVLIEKATFCKK